MNDLGPKFEFSFLEFGKLFISGRLGDFEELAFTKDLKGASKNLLLSLAFRQKSLFKEKLGKVSIALVHRDGNEYLFAQIQRRREGEVFPNLPADRFFNQIRFIPLRREIYLDLMTAGNTIINSLVYKKPAEAGTNKYYTLENYSQISQDTSKIIVHSLNSAGTGGEVKLFSPLLFRDLENNLSEKWLQILTNLTDQILLKKQVVIYAKEIPFEEKLGIVDSIQRLLLPFGKVLTFVLDELLDNYVDIIFTEEDTKSSANIQRFLYPSPESRSKWILDLFLIIGDWRKATNFLGAEKTKQLIENGITTRNLLKYYLIFYDPIRLNDIFDENFFDCFLSLCAYLTKDEFLFLYSKLNENERLPFLQKLPWKLISFVTQTFVVESKFVASEVLAILNFSQIFSEVEALEILSAVLKESSFLVKASKHDLENLFDIVIKTYKSNILNAMDIFDKLIEINQADLPIKIFFQNYLSRLDMPLDKLDIVIHKIINRAANGDIIDPGLLNGKKSIWKDSIFYNNTRLYSAFLSALVREGRRISTDDLSWLIKHYSEFPWIKNILLSVSMGDYFLDILPELSLDDLELWLTETFGEDRKGYVVHGKDKLYAATKERTELSESLARWLLSKEIFFESSDENEIISDLDELKSTYVAANDGKRYQFRSLVKNLAESDSLWVFSKDQRSSDLSFRVLAKYAWREHWEFGVADAEKSVRLGVIEPKVFFLRGIKYFPQIISRFDPKLISLHFDDILSSSKQGGSFDALISIAHNHQMDDILFNRYWGEVIFSPKIKSNEKEKIVEELSREPINRKRMLIKLSERSRGSQLTELKKKDYKVFLILLETYLDFDSAKPISSEAVVRLLELASDNAKAKPIKQRALNAIELAVKKNHVILKDLVKLTATNNFNSKQQTSIRKSLGTMFPDLFSSREKEEDVREVYGSENLKGEQSNKSSDGLGHRSKDYKFNLGLLLILLVFFLLLGFSLVTNWNDLVYIVDFVNKYGIMEFFSLLNK